MPGRFNNMVSFIEALALKRGFVESNGLQYEIVNYVLKQLPERQKLNRTEADLHLQSPFSTWCFCSNSRSKAWFECLLRFQGKAQVTNVSRKPVGAMSAIKLSKNESDFWSKNL